MNSLVSAVRWILEVTLSLMFTLETVLSVY